MQGQGEYSPLGDSNGTDKPTSGVCNFCHKRHLDCQVIAGSWAQTCTACKKCHMLYVQGSEPTAGQKRKQAAAMKTVMLTEDLEAEAEVPYVTKQGMW